MVDYHNLFILVTILLHIAFIIYQRRLWRASRLWTVIIQTVYQIYEEDFIYGVFQRAMFSYFLGKEDLTFAPVEAMLVFLLARDALIWLCKVRDDLLTSNPDGLCSLFCPSCFKMITHMVFAAFVCASFAYWTTLSVSRGLPGSVVLSLAYFAMFTAIMAEVAP